MSLINKMLQDLDARGSQGGAPLQAEIKPVARGDRAVPMPLVIGCALGAAALAVAGVFGWRYIQRPGAPVPLVTQATMGSPAALAAAVAPVAAPVATPVATPVAVPVAAPAPAPVAAAVAATPVEAKPEAPVPARSAVNKPAAIRVMEVAAPAPLVRTPLEAQTPRRQPPDDDYRRALGSLADGRTDESIAQLEQALRADPRHEAARQTLVGLLIEAHRSDEAIRVLQAGLALDVKQPALAMLLARLQIQGGGSGVDTLLRSLPAAGGNADYHAFLAGALERDQRHREAAEQYVAALRVSPENGVWLMGLGISLLADKRPADALEAFQRARAAGNLPPELQGFVERKIGQIGR